MLSGIQAPMSWQLCASLQTRPELGKQFPNHHWQTDIQPKRQDRFISQYHFTIKFFEKEKEERET